MDNLDREYECVVKKLFSWRRSEPRLSSINKLIDLVGNGILHQQKYIHVAGTNGKGSVSTKVMGGLKNLYGFKVGIFTSPHVLCIRERICIGSDIVLKEDFIKLFYIVEEIVSKNFFYSSFLEVMTIMALIYFYIGPNVSQKKMLQLEHHPQNITPYCDFVVLETGIGGRLDATNFIKQPLCAIITSIGWDHTNMLGNTLEQIAMEKFGIIKSGSPVVLGPSASNYDDILVNRLNEFKKNPFIYNVPACNGHGETFNEENTRVAAAALDILLNNNESTHKNLKNSLNYNLLNKSHYDCCLKCQPKYRLQPLKYDEVERVTESIRNELKCNFQIAPPLAVYLDVGHNATALIRISQDLVKKHPFTRISIAFSLSYQRSLRIIYPAIEFLGDMVLDLVYLNSNHCRLRTLEDILTEKNDDKETNMIIEILQNKVNESHHRIQNLYIKKYQEIEEKSLSQILRGLFISAGMNQSVLLICGTFFVVQEVLSTFNLTPSVDVDCFELSKKGL